MGENLRTMPEFNLGEKPGGFFMLSWSPRLRSRDGLIILSQSCSLFLEMIFEKTEVCKVSSLGAKEEAKKTKPAG